MIDWHSHILPGMDDGSRDTAESLSLLEMQAEQGIDTVAATPHFYANDESVDTFLERRAIAKETLDEVLPPDAPRILLGAEVRYYQGISRLNDLKRLCLQNSKLLVLEMHIARWTEYTIREIIELASAGDITVMMAHIERYMKVQNDRTWERLYERGILMQVNASFFIDIGTRRRALSLLQDGGIHFIGSDCHSVNQRPPKIGRAYEIIEKKLGPNYLDQFCGFGYSMLTY